MANIGKPKRIRYIEKPTHSEPSVAPSKPAETPAPAPTPEPVKEPVPA